MSWPAPSPPRFATGRDDEAHCYAKGGLFKGLVGHQSPWHISRGHSVCTNSVGFGIFPGVFALFVRCTKMLLDYGASSSLFSCPFFPSS